MAKSNVANTLVVPTASKDFPYYDDYDEDKNFHRILFRPGYAVQARELTQAQTIAQNQIERFGQHIFKEGSRVLGGDVGYKVTDIITLSPTFNGEDVNVSIFQDKTIYQANNSNIRARVLAIDTTTPLEPKLAIKYLSGEEFQVGANARISGTVSNATVSAANSSIKGTIAHVSEGVFFISGFFVKAPNQAIVLSTASTKPSNKVGLELSDEIITEAEDTTLLDPALEASNYQAPGASRYKINLTLAKRTLESEDDLSKFIELLRVENGVEKFVNKYPIYSELGDTLARRTYDESGDYTVNPFLLELKANSANANLVNVILDPGKAYVKGYEFETIAPTTIPVKRARTKRSVANYDLNMPLGNYVTVNKIRASGNSFFDVNNYNRADVHCVKHSDIATANDTVYNSTKIGTTLVTNMVFDNSTNNQDSDSFVFRAYLSDTNFISINSDTVAANANSTISYQKINIQTDGAATRQDWYNLNAAGNGEFRLLFNTYAVRNNVNVYVGGSTSQTALLFTTMGTDGIISVASTPTEAELLEHEELGGSRFIGGNGKPPNLGVDDITRFGIIRLNKFGGWVYPDGTANVLNSHVKIEVTGSSPHEYSFSIRANVANAKIALANATSALKYSSIDNAYRNTTIRVYEGPGKNYRGTIVAYNGATRIATVSPPFTGLLPNNSSKVAITFDQTDMQSMITGGRQKESRADITIASKVGGVDFGDTFTSESSFTSLIYPLPDSPIAASSIADQQYAYKRVYPSVTFNSSGEAQISQSSTGTSEAFVGSGVLSATQILNNYLVIVKDSRGSANVANGQIISFAQTGYSVNVSSGIAYFTADLDSSDIPAGFVADVYATSEINSGIKSEQKTKILTSANTSYFTTAAASGGPFGTSNTAVYLGAGQIYIRNPNRTSGNTDSLFVSDVFKVNAIFEAANTNVGSISPNKNLSELKNITSNYTLNNGQKENIYDHAYITLKPGKDAPRGSILVCVDYFQHSAATSDGYGYFSVDSYSNVTYENIPTFIEPKSGDIYNLRDCIDFRPVRTNATNNQSSFSLTGARVPIPNEDFNLDYQYYLPRIDKLVLSRSLAFKVYEGRPRELPEEPKITDDDMLLYTLEIPAYTFRPKDITIKYKENKRYTMRDIGVIEQRVQNLEYYSTLSLLEKNAMEKTVLDNNGLERTKYGILVDSFSTFDVGDFDNSDFSSSIERSRGELTPRQEITDIPMVYRRNDPDVVRKNDLIFLKYTSNTFISQPFASKPTAISDFLIARFDGQVKLSPETDIFYDDIKVPDNIVNIGVQNLNTVVTDRDVTTWNGTTTKTKNVLEEETVNKNNKGKVVSTESSRSVTTSTTTSTSKTQRSTTTTSTSTSVSAISFESGDKLVDVSIIPYMRERPVFYLGAQLRNNRRMYHFFDGIDVDAYVARPNIITIRKTNDKKFLDLRRESGEEIYAGANAAQVLLSENFTASNTGYVKLHVSPEFDADSAGLGFDVNPGRTSFVSMGGTPRGNTAFRTFTYRYPKSNGNLYIFYNTYAAFNQVDVYRSNNQSVIYHSNGEINVSSTLVDKIFSTTLESTDARSPNRREIKEYLSLDEAGYWNGGNTKPSRLIGPWGRNGADGLTDVKRFGVFELDYNHMEGNTIHVIVGGDRVATDESKPGSPFQFAVSLGKANSSLLFEGTELGAGQTVTGLLSGATGQITAVDHYSGAARIMKGANKIKLERAASSVNDYYVGNTIYIVSGQGAGQSRTITNYVGETRIATVSSNWNTLPISNSVYSIGTATTTKRGLLPGVFFLPSDDDGLKFRTGERAFKITDSALNNDDDATTKAQRTFISTGLVRKTQSDSVSTRVEETTSTFDPSNPPLIMPWLFYNDPLAQSFFVNVKEYPEGMFLESVDLYFRSKDDSIPVSIKIKKMINGYPSASVIPGSRVVVDADDVNISDIPSMSDSSTATRFTFRAPIHLKPGEYALTIYSDSKEYEAWIAEMGEPQVGTTSRITQQPYVGSLFKSSNDSTWTAFQFQDLMFRINKCKFTLGEGTTIFTNRRLNIKADFDAFTFTMDDVNFANTSINYEIQTNQDSYFDITNGERIKFRPSNGAYTRRTAGKEANTVNVRVTMSTSSVDLSPVIDIDRAQLRVVKNIINDGGIYEKDFRIVNIGSGYTSLPSIAITAKAGDGGSSANAMALLTDNDELDALDFDNNGTGYFGTPTVSVIGGGGSGAEVEIISEESPEGGNFDARYITRKVTLADGFDAGDLKVYLDAYKPAGTDIAVYYRILSSTDNTPFERRPYILMDQIGKDVRSRNPDDFIEYEFTPSLTSDRARYNPDDKENQFRSFKYFAIKIVMSSNFECRYPIIKNLRVMALPEGAS